MRFDHLYSNSSIITNRNSHQETFENSAVVVREKCHIFKSKLSQTQNQKKILVSLWVTTLVPRWSEAAPLRKPQKLFFLNQNGDAARKLIASSESRSRSLQFPMHTQPYARYWKLWACILLRMHLVSHALTKSVGSRSPSLYCCSEILMLLLKCFMADDLYRCDPGPQERIQSSGWLSGNDGSRKDNFTKVCQKPCYLYAC